MLLDDVAHADEMTESVEKTDGLNRRTLGEVVEADSAGDFDMAELEEVEVEGELEEAGREEEPEAPLFQRSRLSRATTIRYILSVSSLNFCPPALEVSMMTVDPSLRADWSGAVDNEEEEERGQSEKEERVMDLVKALPCLGRSGADGTKGVPIPEISSKT